MNGEGKRLSSYGVTVQMTVRGHAKRLKVRYSGIELGPHEYYQDKSLFFEGVNKLPKQSDSGVTFAHRGKLDQLFELPLTV